MNLTEEEKKALLESKTADEYGHICLSIKKARDGRYPEDWYPLVMAPGGIQSSLAERWKAPDAFAIKVGR